MDGVGSYSPRLDDQAAETVVPNVESEAAPNRMLIVSGNRDAFAARVLAARAAKSTLDLMYYIWRDDHCGRLLISEVVAAANRGVKVRLLIDDINPQESDANYLRLVGHPNIQLKLFNPSGLRRRGIFRALELVVRVRAMNRRMHCKAWIADGETAIVGGRNIGDEYFDAAETNFRDIDLLMIGPVAAQAQAVFDRYWDYEGSWPIEALNPARASKKKPPASLSGVETEDALADVPTIDAFVAARGPFITVDRARMIADPPEKAAGRRSVNWIMKEIETIISAATAEVRIVSPYFVPGRAGVRVLADLVKRGVSAAVVTNSLAATDVAAVHGGYANYRRRLLRKGVSIYEFQRSAETPKISVFGSKGASLHTKAFTVDDRHGFVGSLNFDPRSASLNNEMGVLFEDAEMARQIGKVFDHDMSPSASYRVWLEQGLLRWEGMRDGRMQRYSAEPVASLRRRFIAFVVRWLPMESQL